MTWNSCARIHPSTADLLHWAKHVSCCPAHWSCKTMGNVFFASRDSHSEIQGVCFWMWEKLGHKYNPGAGAANQLLGQSVAWQSHLWDCTRANSTLQCSPEAGPPINRLVVSTLRPRQSPFGTWVSHLLLLLEMFPQDLQGMSLEAGEVGVPHFQSRATGNLWDEFVEVGNPNCQRQISGSR